MRSPFASVAIVLISVSLAACGGASKADHASPPAVATGEAQTTTADAAHPTTPPSTTTHSSATTSQAHAKDSNDGDSDPNSNDDLEVLDYGHAASPSDTRTITALVTRYYKAAAADDGSTACSQIFSLVAEAIVEDYGEPPGPADLRGKSCAVVLSKEFKLEHQKVAAKAAALEVTGARIKGKKGLVLLRFGSKAQLRYIPVRLEFGVWKVYTMSDSSLP